MEKIYKKTLINYFNIQNKVIFMKSINHIIKNYQIKKKVLINKYIMIIKLTMIIF